jgi:hypothetical protein
MMQPTIEQVDRIPQLVLDKITGKLDSVRTALLAKDPQMAQHLRESHSLLQQYPETAHLLDDAEIKLLLDAAQEYTKIKIVAEASKGGKGGSRKAVNVNDL